MSRFEEDIQMLIDSSLAGPDDIKGCSPEQLVEISDANGARLPASYQELMATIGISAGDLMRGSDFHYPGVLGLKDSAKKLLKECKSDWKLRDSDVVFMGHQGYQFLFISVEEGEDPPVLWYMEYSKVPERLYSTFSSWFKACVEEEVAAAPDHAASKGSRLFSK